MIEMGGCTYSSSNDLEEGRKDVPLQRFSRWQQARHFLKVCHHFRYALVLKDQEKKEQTTKKVRVQALAILAAHVLKEGADQVQGAGDHVPIQPDKLAKLTRTNSGVDVLKKYGGKEGLAAKLKTDFDKGISGDDLQERRIKFGSNEYPPRTGRRLRTCIWEALHDFTWIVLVIAFVGSVVMGILEETEKLGWHDIFSVAIVAAIFILVTAISDYSQDRQFQHMIKEIKRNNMQSKEVTAVGKFPESENLMPSTNSKDAEKTTRLQVLLKEVATFMGAVGFLVAVVVAYVVWFRDCFTGDNLNGCHPIPGNTLEEVIKISLIAAPIFVVAVPEVLRSLIT